jgi:hypothetical protein
MALELVGVVEKADRKVVEKAGQKVGQRGLKADPKKGNHVLNEKVISTKRLQQQLPSGLLPSGNYSCGKG